MTDYFKKAELALTYLGESEEEYARYKALAKYQPERLKAALALIENRSIESTQAGKEREAKASDEYSDVLDESQEITEQCILLEAKRNRAELTIEMYRSVNSALKRGNMT